VFRHLLESAPKRQRTRSAAIISFAIHAALVSSAVAATKLGPEPDYVDLLPTPTPYYIPTPPPAAPAPPARPTVAPAAPSSPISPIVVPVEVPTSLPAIPEPGTSPMDPWTTLPSAPGVPGGTGDSDAPAGPAGDAGPMWPEDVERHAVPLGSVRQPRYPEPLRASRLEGSLLATFVVDTLGRVEPASFKARDVTHPLFEQAVRTAVLGQRFRPAQWNGRRVRQLVEQQFVFRLGR